jgi:hypothetical protein
MHRRHLLAAYAQYREVVETGFALTCDRGGLGLMVHTYAPRSIDVAVDADIGKSLRAAYAADRIGSWPLRPGVDLITHDPDGRELAAPGLAQRAAAELLCAAPYDPALAAAILADAGALLQGANDAARTALAHALVALSLEQLAYFKAPGYVAFVDALPLTPTQKVQRGELKALAATLPGSACCIDTRALKKRPAAAGL